MIPTRLKVRGHIYDVQQIKGSSVNKTNLAEIHFDQNLIQIPRGISPTQKIELLLHEVAHAMIHEFNLKDDVDEQMSTAIGEALTSFLWDNPVFIRDALKKLS